MEARRIGLGSFQIFSCLQGRTVDDCESPQGRHFVGVTDCRVSVKVVMGGVKVAAGGFVA